jgi:hypothetical protein
MFYHEKDIHYPMIGSWSVLDSECCKMSTFEWKKAILYVDLVQLIKQNYEFDLKSIQAIISYLCKY